MLEAPKPTLRAINTAIHELGQDYDPLPVLLAGAGTPSPPGVLADATSYTERLYDYSEIDALARPAADTALVTPARDPGVGWMPATLDAAADFGHGYPYFIQTHGKHAWNASASASITAEDVAVALDCARSDIDTGPYRARWQHTGRHRRGRSKDWKDHRAVLGTKAPSTHRHRADLRS